MSDEGEGEREDVSATITVRVRDQQNEEMFFKVKKGKCWREGYLKDLG